MDGLIEIGDDNPPIFSSLAYLAWLHVRRRLRDRARITNRSMIEVIGIQTYLFKLKKISCPNLSVVDIEYVFAIHLSAER
jgi:hypothetical protein